MRYIVASIFLAVHLYLITQVSGLNLDKAKKASTKLSPEELGISKSVNCKNLKCPSEEHVCVKLRTNIEVDPINTLIMVMNKCEFEYTQCKEGMEAIELPMKYCRHKQALDNARKAPSNRRPKRSLGYGENARTNIRSKRSPEIATKTPYNNLASQGIRKRLGNNKPKINYNSLYFGPKSRKDADAEDSAETREEESPKRNQEVDSKTVFLTIQTNNANRDVQAANNEGEPSKESANRNLEVDPENGVDEEKKIALTIQTNNANRDVEGAKSTEADNANRDVGEPSKESANMDQEIDADNGAVDGEERQKISLIVQTNADVQALHGDDIGDGSNTARDAKENERSDDEKQQVVVMIDPGNGNRQDDNDDNADESENDPAGDVAASEDNEQEVKPKAVDEGDDEDQNTRDPALEEDNEIDGEGENKEELKDEEGNDENDGNVGVAIENPGGARVDVIIGNAETGETLGGQDEDSEKHGPNRLDDAPDSSDAVFDGNPGRHEIKESSVEQDRSSIEGGNKPADYEDVDIDEYKSDCPSVCPARDVMVCARCKEGVYRTFLSVCHLRMFNCKHPEEKLELVGRSPCMMSAPFLNDMPKAQGRVSEPGDEDNIVEYLRCKGKSALRDPKCRQRANEEARKRRHKI